MSYSVNLILEQPLVEKIDAIAKKHGVSRSKFVKALVLQHLKKKEAEEKMLELQRQALNPEEKTNSQTAGAVA